MYITIVSASTRNNSQSRKVSNYLSSRLTGFGTESTILDLNEKRLPIFDTTENSSWTKMWEEIKKLLEISSGNIFVSPEWDGMLSVGLHNLFHYVNKELADKPVLTVGVSSGRGGRYPLQQMRVMGYKNKNFVIIPESLFYDHIEKALVDNALTDERAIERTDYALKVLIEYAKALTAVRKSGVIDYKKYPNGL